MSVGLNRLQRETDPEGRATLYQGSLVECQEELRAYGGSRADRSATSSGEAPKEDVISRSGK